MSAAKALEALPLSRFHYTLLLVASLTYFFAAMNVVLIAPALDKVIKEFALDPFLVGTYVIGIFYLGMLLGACSCGFLSDRIGRRIAILITTTIHAIFTALLSFARDLASLAIFRLIAGYGAGGVLPLPGVYMAEYAPAKYRGRFLGIVETAWVFGALLAAGLGLLIIPRLGWRSFALTGLIPLILIPALAFIPESFRYLERRGQVDKAKAMLARFGIKLDPLSQPQAERAEVRISELFSREYLPRTIVLWTLWFALVYTYHGIFIWLKAFFEKAGTIPDPLFFYFAVTLVQIPGYLSATFLLDKVGRKPVLVTYLLLSGLGCLGFALSQEFIPVLLTSSAIGFFNLGAWAGLYAYTPELYPTRIRGTGSGTAASCGRIGGFLQGPLTGLILMSLGLPGTFLKFAAVHWVAAIVVLLLGIETRGKVLEEIAR